jgi:prepilin-type N-terminal cleavage/methylation domain-containing protein
MLTKSSQAKLLKRKTAFTLAELLISLAILGVIATFTIPKILASQANGSANARALEVASMISAALQAKLLTGTPFASIQPTDLIPYMNFASQDTSGTLIDGHPLVGSRTCDSSTPCLKLHNGGTLWFGFPPLLEFDFDPDGVYSGSINDSPGKSVQFSVVNSQGRITTRGQYPGWESPTLDPSWFHWN